MRNCNEKYNDKQNRKKDRFFKALLAPEAKKCLAARRFSGGNTLENPFVY
jgi:hypothetical protein